MVSPSDDNLMVLARSPDVAVRASVATRAEVPPELLYYLSTDKDIAVRVAAAENPLTPVQSLPNLQLDESWQVRAAVARKIGRVLPDMREGLARQTVLSTLEALCRDTADEVRRAVAESLQDTAFLPRPLAMNLAQDSARAVASPVLRFCLSLSDEDLITLVKKAKRAWIPVEVAQRPRLSNPVALAIWETGDSEAAAALLGNVTAQATPDMLDEATETAAVEVVLQPPLVVHPQLNGTQMERLATFVDGTLLESLATRVAGLDQAELSEVSAVIRRRLDLSAWRKQESSGSARARALFARNELDDTALSDAIAWGERDFVVTALALGGNTREALVEKVLAHQSPKGITALCWHAGFSMRTCRQVQIRIARVPAGKALNAREGFHYPMYEADMIWQLEFYGILA